MRRPFLWPAVSFAVGIISGRFFSLPQTLIFVLLLSLLPFLWFLRGKAFFLPLFLLSLWGIGVLRIQEVSKLPPHHIAYFARGEWVSLEGRVVSLPELKQKGKREISSLVLEAENLIWGHRFFETTGKVQVFLFNPSQQAPYGGRIRIRGKLNRPRIPQNPGEFNYQKYLAEQGIFAVFEGYGPRALRILDPKTALSGGPMVLIQKLRDLCAHRLDALFPLPVNALLKALLLGIRKDLPEGFRDDFIKTGTTHLIAISGMNITLVAGSLFFLALCLGCPQKGAAVVGLFSTASYVFLSGAGMPVVRAGWMAGLFFTGLLLEREKDLANSLFFALFMILIFDPQALFQVGLELSFLSVLSLIVFTSRRESEWEGDWLQTGIVLIGTFPLCIVYFNVFSWVSLFANLLVIPLFHLGVLGGLAALLGGGIPLIGPGLVAVASFFLKAGLAWIHFWAEKPWGYFHLSPPSWKLVWGYYLALALAILTQRPKISRFRLLRPFVISLWLIITILFFLPPRSPNFVLTLLASGPNEIFHVEFPGGNHWLVNTGRVAPSNQARWLLAPLLRREGTNRLAGILLTDFSSRHSGGLTTLLGNFRTGSLLFPAASKIPDDLGAYLRSSRLRWIAKIRLYAGDRVPVHEKGGFEVLAVVKGQVFLMIYYGEQKFLLLPTWNPAILKEALPRLKGLSSVDVLIFPASGEPDAVLGKEIVSLLVPQWVIFPRPKPSGESLLECLKKEEIPFLFLSETGALRLEVQKGKFSISPFLKPGIH